MKLEQMDFSIQPYTGADKAITINGHGVRAWVDHDDCSHKDAAKFAKAIAGLPGMVAALKTAEATFNRYAEGHDAKAVEAQANQNPEAALAYRSKAENNLAESQAIRRALKAAGVA